MRGLAIGIALTGILVLVPGGHFLLVLLIPLAFFALLRYRTTWHPRARTSPSRSRATSPAERELSLRTLLGRGLVSEFPLVRGLRSDSPSTSGSSSKAAPR
jgi:hypothetical protein